MKLIFNLLYRYLINYYYLYYFKLWNGIITFYKYLSQKTEFLQFVCLQRNIYSDTIQLSTFARLFEIFHSFTSLDTDGKIRLSAVAELASNQVCFLEQWLMDEDCSWKTNKSHLYLWHRKKYAKQLSNKHGCRNNQFNLFLLPALLSCYTVKRGYFLKTSEMRLKFPPGGGKPGKVRSLKHVTCSARNKTRVI